MKILPVIIAGGSGTRLWPLSRFLYPKQFLSLFNKTSLLQTTILRITNKYRYKPPLLISNNKYRFIVTEQLKKIGINNFKIILEPVSRNTAPAIALAALYALKRGDDPLILVLASDHIIQNSKEFNNSIILAKIQAEKGNIVTFGVIPSRAETNYGYIRPGKSLVNSVYEIDVFIEKPDQTTAEQYIRDSRYLWNSGIFMFKASVYMEELKKFNPKIAKICQLTINRSSFDSNFIRLEKKIFSNCPNESIDYAIMQKTNLGVVIPLNTQWCDIGSWNSLWDFSKKDHNGNVIHGDVIYLNSKNNYIYSENSLISVIGIDECVLVQTKDAVLVAKKDQIQNIKEIINILKSKKS